MTPFGYTVLGFGSGGVVSTARSESIPAAAEVVFESAIVQWVSVAYDQQTAGKFVVVYQDDDNSDYGTAIVGSVSGTTVSYGTPVVFESAQTKHCDISFNPNTALKCVVCYQDQGNSQYGTALVGTVSGTSISFGSAVVFESAECDRPHISYDHNSSVDKCAIVYQDAGNSANGTAAVGTVSGTSISFGTPVVFNAASTDWNAIAFDPNTDGKCLIQFMDGGNSNYGTCIVGQISGTSMTFGSEVTFNSGQTQSGTVAADPNNADKYVVDFRDDPDNDKGKARVVTVSGTTPSYGAVEEYSPGAANNQTISFDPNNANKFAIGYNANITNQSVFAQIGTISGTGISFGTRQIMEVADEQSYVKVAFDPNTPGMFIVCWRGGDPNRFGRSRLCQMESA